MISQYIILNTDYEVRMFKQIESIYHTMNIYKSLILFNDDKTFIALKKMLLKNDYPLTSEEENGRIYDVNINRLKEVLIDLDNISLILCLDNESYTYIKKLKNNYSNLNLIIKI